MTDPITIKDVVVKNVCLAFDTVFRMASAKAMAPRKPAQNRNIRMSTMSIWVVRAIQEMRPTWKKQDVLEILRYFRFASKVQQKGQWINVGRPPQRHCYLLNSKWIMINLWRGGDRGTGRWGNRYIMMNSQKQCKWTPRRSGVWETWTWRHQCTRIWNSQTRNSSTQTRIWSGPVNHHLDCCRCNGPGTYRKTGQTRSLDNRWRVIF